MEKTDNFLAEIISDIENSDFNRVEKKTRHELFELWSDPALLADLAGNTGAFYVRAILNKLNVDEHRVLRWRLENKYRQYQVLNHYIPGCMAKTISFSKVLAELNGVQKIRALCEEGYFIKSTLGHSTGRLNSFDRTGELENIISSYQQEEDNLEKWMLQKKLNLKEEFRIHTFNRDLIYGVSFIMAGEDSSISIAAEAYVTEILKKLPDTILNGTLIGWDIGITTDQKFYIIEANITGFHPEFHRGFQTSGYFGDPDYGAIMCAWLNNYFKNNYNISVGSVEATLFQSSKFYEKFMFYTSLFRSEHMEFLKNKAKGIRSSAIVYLGGEINLMLINLIRYFQEEDFARRYYLITDGKYAAELSGVLAKNELLRVIAEDTLFTKEQYILIKELEYERRKQISFYHTMRLINEDSCLMI